MSYQKAFLCGLHEGELRRLIARYKFERCREAHKALADILDASLPIFGNDVVVVPVPTISKHIRERGYDHILLLSKRFAKLRGLKLEVPLRRNTDATQLKASALARRSQAKTAFSAIRKLDQTKTYLLVDDVTTTGSTIEEASKKLCEAGATKVWVAVIAKQL